MKKLFVKIGLLTFITAGLLGASCKKPIEDPDVPTFDVTSSCTEAEVKIVNVEPSNDGVGTTTWTKNNVYVLNGMVFVNSGQTLTIEAGTIIKGADGSVADASALVVARGGKIMAKGTKEEPIVFTSIADGMVRDVDGVLCASGNLSNTEQGLWGGLIILGNSPLNTIPSIQNIEGIPTSETRGKYGGSDAADNSGILTYISIRHGGTNIGADNEINGLTLGGVGSGTTIEHVEVIANQDDGIEFFGGTVNLKWAVVSNCGDDSYDYDQGWRGKGQFWYTQQNANDLSQGDRGGEHDGGTDPEDAAPYATPEIRNATYHGHGASRLLTFRDNAGGHYINSIFVNWNKGIDIEDLASGEDSRARLDAGDLSIEHNVFHSISVGTTLSALLVSNKGNDLSTHVNINNNSVEDPGITATNPVPTATLTAGSAPSDSWFENVTYKGAFSGSNWASGWTLLFE